MPQQTAKLSAFPVFMRVERSTVVVVGNGAEALAKARLISQSSASLKVVAVAPELPLREWISANQVIHVAEDYNASHLQGAVLVFAASADAELDSRISQDARRLGIPVNAVDRPELCDFFTPAIVNRAPVCRSDRHGRCGAGACADDPGADRPAAVAVARRAWPRLPRPSATPPNGCCRKGEARRRFWNEFFGGAPARALEVGHVREAHRGSGRTPPARQRRRRWPCRAGRRRPGRGGPADACAPSAC